MPKDLFESQPKDLLASTKPKDLLGIGEEAPKAEAEAKDLLASTKPKDLLAVEEEGLKVEAEAEAKAVEEELRLKREKERAEKEAVPKEEAVVRAVVGAHELGTPAAVQLSYTDKLIAYLSRVHRRQSEL